MSPELLVSPELLCPRNCCCVPGIAAATDDAAGVGEQGTYLFVQGAGAALGARPTAYVPRQITIGPRDFSITRGTVRTIVGEAGELPPITPHYVRAAENVGDLVRIGKNRVTFQGMEVRAVRDLSHMSDSTLKAMLKRGFSGKTVDGETIVLHHHRQNPDGFIVELPASKHSIGNVNQHPYGNTKGMGLTTEQRAAFDDWRVDYWKARAQSELQRRARQ